MYSMFRFQIFLILIGIAAVLSSGCQKQGVVRPQGVQPFVPVHIEFKSLREDASVEKEIVRHLFCNDCLFTKADTTSSPYTLIVRYERNMDLKSLGLVILSLNLSAIEAQFFYILQIDLLEGDTVLKEYVYTEQTQEKTDSTLGDTFNPFHDANGRSEEIFAELTDRFLREVMIDNPLPRVANSLVK